MAPTVKSIPKQVYVIGWRKVRVRYRKRVIALSRRQWEELLLGMQSYLQCFPKLDITRRSASLVHPTRPHLPRTREGEILDTLEHGFLGLKTAPYEDEDELEWESVCEPISAGKWCWIPNYLTRDFGIFCGRAAQAGFIDPQRVPSEIVVKILGLCEADRELVVTDDPKQVPSRKRARVKIVSRRKGMRQSTGKRPPLSLVWDSGKSESL